MSKETLDGEENSIKNYDVEQDAELTQDSPLFAVINWDALIVVVIKPLFVFSKSENDFDNEVSKFKNSHFGNFSLLVNSAKYLRKNDKHSIGNAEADRLANLAVGVIVSITDRNKNVST